MLALVALAFLVACGACFGLGWFARGERSARGTADAAAIVLRAASASQGRIAEAKAEHELEVDVLEAEDNLGPLLSENVPR